MKVIQKLAVAAWVAVAVLLCTVEHAHAQMYTRYKFQVPCIVKRGNTVFKLIDTAGYIPKFAFIKRHPTYKAKDMNTGRNIPHLAEGRLVLILDLSK